VLLGHDTGRGHAAADQPAASGDVIGVNLRGCAALVHELKPLLIAGRCAIVNVSSEGAFKARADHDRPRRAGIRRPPGRQVQSPVPRRSRYPLLFRTEPDRVMNDKEILKITEASAS
jgi:NAD(P)-dependent dehydrogenase (short-subunit alcohol dehydrogenase family)